MMQYQLLLKQLRRYWGIVLIGLLFVSSLFVPYADVLTEVTSFCIALGIPGIIFFTILYTILCMTLAPGSLITMSASAIYGFGLGYIIVTIGSLGAAAFSFLLGKYFMHRKVEQWMQRYPRVAHFQQAIEKRGLLIVFLMRLSPLFPFAISNYAFSLTSLSFWRYFFISWVGMIPGTLLYVYLGAMGKKMMTEETMGHYQIGLLIAGGIATAVITVIIGSIAKNSLNHSLSDTSDHL
ncbi:MAG: VTT domain-containing protein [Fibrobacterales bacterium]